MTTTYKIVFTSDKKAIIYTYQYSHGTDEPTETKRTVKAVQALLWMHKQTVKWHWSEADGNEQAYGEERG